MEAMEQRHREDLKTADDSLVGVADDVGLSLVDVIAAMEHYIVEETKVGDGALVPVPPGRRGYTLNRVGRLVELSTGGACDAD
jgi:hypothetical protein